MTPAADKHPNQFNYTFRNRRRLSAHVSAKYVCFVNFWFYEYYRLRQRFSVYSAASTSLPSQCFSYSTNNDSTRNVAYGSGLLCDNSLVTGWYRFVQPAGTMIVASVTNVYQCSTIAPGWLNSSYPTTLGQAVTGYVCLNVGGVICQYSYPILITNCSSFYVYFLAPVTICYARYCTT
ncbi:unnamed protein product [Didymodactylos carnosus]|uniref:Uncharacterized protein n=1 Tax=Didymodactylos carnosus TaxID=1234261 RepID=A0A815N5T8_9BILA|nr:unnamed protein product [Didymodactylos carnosus]CAF4306235.1 unnamed protein product [Didymodactylos carnosus]